ncbi:MAG: hypothetical protein U0800_18830 [Isosphaeraceae bacterium]
MNLADLLKLIIPAIFLVIWAVNQLLGKEEVTAPPRGQPVGPRPGGLPPAPRPPVSREVPQGWPSPSAAATPPRAKPKADAFADSDDIFVIRGDGDPFVRPAPKPSIHRRAARSRPAAAPKAPEPAAPKRLGAPLPTGLTNTPIDVKLNERTSTSTPAIEPLTTPPHPLAELIRSPGRLREALLLNEILGPPRSLRGHRR